MALARKMAIFRAVGRRAGTRSHFPESPVGMPLLVILLLRALACVAVRPRTPQILYGTTGTLALMIAIVLVLVMGGVLPW